MGKIISCFKAYDIRGRVPDELNEDVAYRIGRAYAAFLTPRRVIVGHDIRLSGPGLSAALSQGLLDAGVDVVDIGLCGTEEVYFSTFFHKMDGGIMVTASHNPKDYNGMKFVREGSRPISADTGLLAIRALAEAGVFPSSKTQGKRIERFDKSAYITHMAASIDHSVLRPLRIVANAGNGSAGPVLDLLQAHLPFEFIKIHNEPDGRFPHGVPNPLLVQNRQATVDAIRLQGADLGIAWDGDFDRCFFFDEQGAFIEGYYIVGLLAQALLQGQAGEKVIYDPRLTWNTVELVGENAGIAVMSKTGHAFIKERMRAEDAIYGGEMSAHHYFREFAYCDSGMLPWLKLAELICRSGRSLSDWVGERMRRFPCSGEINFVVDDVSVVLATIETQFAEAGAVIDRTDGLSMDFPDWRFNVRASNTEPMLRLNVETRADPALLERRLAQLSEVIHAQSARGS